MDLYEAIRTRRDVETFAPQRPPRDVIERILEAAVWAPNHKMTEPWRFHVLAGEGQTRMADAVSAWLEANGRGEAPQKSARSKLTRAPVIVVVTQVGNPDDPVRDLEDYAACAIAVQNMLLAAHAEGLVAHLSTDLLAQYEGAKQYLGLQPHDRIVAYVNLGYIREGATPKPGTRAEPVVRWDWS
jgi:nitroreductase